MGEAIEPLLKKYQRNNFKANPKNDNRRHDPKAIYSACTGNAVKRFCVLEFFKVLV
jgi:hypothetical protein